MVVEYVLNHRAGPIGIHVAGRKRQARRGRARLSSSPTGSTTIPLGLRAEKGATRAVNVTARKALDARS